MEKKIFMPALLMASLLLFGAGCNEAKKINEAEKNFETKNAANTEIIKETNNENNAANGLNLSAETLGEGQVKLTWTKSDDIKTDAEKGFVLVRSEKTNPENDGINFWFRQSSEKRETVWKAIPAGKLHFRVCALQEEKCAVYSNDVELEVK